MEWYSNKPQPSFAASGCQRDGSWATMRQYDDEVTT